MSPSHLLWCISSIVSPNFIFKQLYMYIEMHPLIQRKKSWAKFYLFMRNNTVTISMCLSVSVPVSVSMSVFLHVCACISVCVCMHKCSFCFMNSSCESVPHLFQDFHMALCYILWGWNEFKDIIKQVPEDIILIWPEESVWPNTMHAFDLDMCCFYA